jgi:hypothetical protein
MSAHPPRSSCVGVIFVLIWTIVTGAADLTVAGGLWQQLRSLGFDQTEGTITKSEVETRKGNKGRTYRALDLAYEYDANGRRYTGNAYETWPTGGVTEARVDEVHGELPAGARVPVYYDPDSPTTAALHPGLTGQGLMTAWFIGPFNVAAVGLWVGVIPRRQFDPARVVRTDAGWSAPLPGVSRPVVFLIALFAVTFAGVFLLGPIYGGEPTAWMMAVACVAAVGIAATAAAVFARYPRLDVDALNRVVRFHPGRGDDVEVPFDKARGVDVVPEVRQQKGGPVTVYRCDLLRRGGPETVRLTTYRDRADADAFAAWLREQLAAKPG